MMEYGGRYGQLQPPQQRGIAAALMSIGEDMDNLGVQAMKGQQAKENSLLQYDLELKKLAQKHQLDLVEIQARTQGEMERDREKDKRKYEQRDKDRAWIQEQMVGRPEDHQYADMVPSDEGPTIAPNPRKYEDAKRKAGIAAHVIAGGAGNYDDYERGARTRYFSDKMEEAPDLETQRRIRQAEKGDQRHRQGESGGQDDWGGQITPTDVSKSKVAENYAQADQAKASAERQREGAKGDKIDRRLSAEDNRIKMIEGAIARKQKLMAESFDDDVKAGYQREIDDLERRRLAAEEERARIADEFNKRQKIPGEDGSPPASSLKEGKRTTFANGQVWTLRNGKPVRLN